MSRTGQNSIPKQAPGPRGQVPEGYRAVAVSEDQANQPLRICVLVGPAGKNGPGGLTVLRDMLDCKAYLGCILDAAGQVQEWIEVWVQDVTGLEGTLAAYRESLTNKQVDERWKRTVEGMAGKKDGDWIWTGWEMEHPWPVVIDTEGGLAVHPTDSLGENRLKLCTDDAILNKHGLPSYSSGLHRYLYAGSGEGDAIFAPVTHDAPTNEHTRDLRDLIPGLERLGQLNLGGGYVMVRRMSGLGYEEFMDYLSGAAWADVHAGARPITLEHMAGLLGEQDGVGQAEGGGRMFMEHHGMWGRMLETLYLKVRMLADAVEAVRGAVEKMKRPLLSLSAESLEVTLEAGGQGMPFLWTARCRLKQAGSAIVLPVPSTDTQYFLPGRPSEQGIYRPTNIGDVFSGVCSVRIRKVMEEGGGVIVEGTMATQDRIRPSRNDLVWLRLNIGGKRVDLYGRMETETALAGGEWRFRTQMQRVGPEMTAALKGEEGRPMAHVPFELLPLLTTPCDLFALGVLAVRGLLVDGQTSLPVALDELLSLAHELETQGGAADDDALEGLAGRIRTLFDQGTRWGESLGPQKLLRNGCGAEEAFDLLPADLWCTVLAAVVRMFPGQGPHTVYKDMSHAPMGGLHRVFEPASQDLGRVLRKIRSLIVIDWHFNREVNSVIREVLTEIGG